MFFLSILIIMITIIQALKDYELHDGIDTSSAIDDTTDDPTPTNAPKNNRCHKHVPIINENLKDDLFSKKDLKHGRDSESEDEQSDVDSKLPRKTTYNDSLNRKFARTPTPQLTRDSCRNKLNSSRSTLNRKELAKWMQKMDPRKPSPLGKQVEPAYKVKYRRTIVFPGKSKLAPSTNVCLKPLDKLDNNKPNPPLTQIDSAKLKDAIKLAIKESRLANPVEAKQPPPMPDHLGAIDNLKSELKNQLSEITNLVKDSKNQTSKECNSKSSNPAQPFPDQRNPNDQTDNNNNNDGSQSTNNLSNPSMGSGNQPINSASAQNNNDPNNPNRPTESGQSPGTGTEKPLNNSVASQNTNNQNSNSNNNSSLSNNALAQTAGLTGAGVAGAVIGNQMNNPMQTNSASNMVENNTNDPNTSSNSGNKGGVMGFMKRHEDAIAMAGGAAALGLGAAYMMNRNKNSSTSTDLSSATQCSNLLADEFPILSSIQSSVGGEYGECGRSTFQIRQRVGRLIDQIEKQCICVLDPKTFAEMNKPPGMISNCNLPIPPSQGPFNQQFGPDQSAQGFNNNNLNMAPSPRCDCIQRNFPNSRFSNTPTPTPALTPTLTPTTTPTPMRMRMTGMYPNNRINPFLGPRLPFQTRTTLSPPIIGTRPNFTFPPLFSPFGI